MPIEFRCLQCGKRVRTGDDTAGKQAKCPSCGSIQQVPTSSSGKASEQVLGSAAQRTYGLAPEPIAARKPFQQAPAARSPKDEANSYRSPAVSLAPDALARAPAQLRPTSIFAGDILTSTWEIYMPQRRMCIWVVFACGALSYCVGMIVTIPYSILLFVVMYLAMSGQPIADQSLYQPPGRASAQTP